MATHSQASLVTLPTDLLNGVLLPMLKREDFFPLASTCRLFGRLCKIPARKKVNGDTIQLLQAAIENVATKGLMDWYRTYLRCPLQTRMTYGAAEAGNLPLLQSLCAEGCPVNSVDVTAAKNGHLHVLQWLVASRHNIRYEMVCKEAAKRNDRRLLEWVEARGVNFDDPRLNDSACAGAAAGGHLDLLQWLKAKIPGQSYDSDSCLGECSLAAQGGHLSVLQWFEERGVNFTEMYGLCYAAAQGGHLEVLKWLRTKGCPWEWSTFSMIMETGQFEMIQWACANDCPRLLGGSNSFPYRDGVKYGNVALLQWAFDKNWPLDTGGDLREELCELAAQRGNLPVLQWLRSHDSEWGQTCRYAAERGHLEVLKWAHFAGAPLDYVHISYYPALIGGHRDVLAWLGSIGCSLEKAVSGAAMSGDTDLLDWLKDKRIPFNDDAFSHAGMGGHKSVLNWMRDRGLAWTPKVFAGAALTGNVAFMEWLRANGCPWDKSAYVFATPAVKEILRSMGCPDS